MVGYPAYSPFVRVYNADVRGAHLQCATIDLVLNGDTIAFPSIRVVNADDSRPVTVQAVKY